MNKLFSHLKGDVFGGITAGIIALPLALAFGVSSGLGPTAGLYGAIFLFATSNKQFINRFFFIQFFNNSKGKCLMSNTPTPTYKK